MTRNSHTSRVRFEPLPPLNPFEWRRRIEAAHNYRPLSELALHVALAAAVNPTEATKYPMSRRTYALIRSEFGPHGLPLPTHEQLCAAVVELHDRNLAAPWWNVNAAQLARFRAEGR